MREKPDKNANIVTVIGQKVKLEFVSEDNGWTQVIFQGQTGYVSSDYVKADMADSTTDSGTSGAADSGAASQGTACLLYTSRTHLRQLHGHRPAGIFRSTAPLTQTISLAQFHVREISPRRKSTKPMRKTQALSS